MSASMSKGRRRRLPGALSALTLLLPMAFAPAAHAAISFTSQHQLAAGQEVDPGPGAGEHVALDFESASTPSGITRIDGAAGTFGFATGSITGLAARPGGDTSQYLYVSTGGAETFLFSAPVGSVSFYWGSVDDYNAVDILGVAAGQQVVLETLTGSAVYGRYQRHFVDSVRLYITDTNPGEITGLRFRSAGNSFEIDNVALGGGTGSGGSGLSGGPGQGVPEPAAWATMLLGLSGMGALLRAARQGPSGSRKAKQAAT
jgi:hypothetical protein